MCVTSSWLHVLAERLSLSLHDALPISDPGMDAFQNGYQLINIHQRTKTRPASSCCTPTYQLINIHQRTKTRQALSVPAFQYQLRSEEHTSELQSRFDLVCRLLLEKKKY